jgi:hypothetical protein
MAGRADADSTANVKTSYDTGVSSSAQRADAATVQAVHCWFDSKRFADTLLTFCCRNSMRPVGSAVSSAGFI